LYIIFFGLRKGISLVAVAGSGLLFSVVAGLDPAIHDKHGRLLVSFWLTEL
jgi:hypothetical protein